MLKENVLIESQSDECTVDVTSWQQVCGSLDFLALDAQLGVELRWVGDWWLLIDEFKQSGVTGLVSLTIQHHCNTDQPTYHITAASISNITNIRNNNVVVK